MATATDQRSWISPVNTFPAINHVQNQHDQKALAFLDFLSYDYYIIRRYFITPDLNKRHAEMANTHGPCRKENNFYMQTITHPLLHKGVNQGNTLIITETETANQFNIYQLFDEYNDYATASDIRAAQSSLKNIPDEQIIVAIPGEEQNAFLVKNHIGIQEMNDFKRTLDEIL